MREPAVDIEIGTRHADGVVALLEHGSAIVAAELTEAPHCAHRLVQAVHDEPGDSVLDDLAHRAVAPGHDGGATGHGLNHHEAERLGPVDREKQGERLTKEPVLVGPTDLADELD